MRSGKGARAGGTSRAADAPLSRTVGFAPLSLTTGFHGSAPALSEPVEWKMG